jgi:hypothetical protein
MKQNVSLVGNCIYFKGKRVLVMVTSGTHGNLMNYTRGNMKDKKARARKLDPPLIFDSANRCFRFANKKMKAYAIWMAWRADWLPSFIIEYPGGRCGFYGTLEEVHAHTCKLAYGDGVLKDDRWMERCDACGNDWDANPGRMLPDDVWTRIAEPEEFLCDSCIAKRLAAREGSAS